MELRVSDIKQFVYCPRVVYFDYVMPLKTKITRKMEYGKERHLEFQGYENRRSLRRYRLDEGERQFGVYLRSERLGLNGLLDLLIVSPAGYFPVEFKDTARPPGLNHKYQLTAYALLLEDVMKRPVRCGFVCTSEGEKRLWPIQITPNARLHCLRIMGAIRNMIRSERLPPLSRSIQRCRECEHIRFCNDVR
ncbi:MAG TPA: CRISPR-associated protein Cas4 [Firmicutes bacterium]|nr:CRISPR-associated protein Cas4 [Bacillota bacterium]